MSDIVVIDNVLSPKLLYWLQNIYPKLKYRFCRDVLYPGDKFYIPHGGVIRDDKNSSGTYQFVCAIFKYLNVNPEPMGIDPVFEDLENALKIMVRHCGYDLDEVSRFKFNLTQPQCRSVESKYNTPHVDDDDLSQSPLHHALIFYLEDSDGDTFLFNEVYNVTKPKPKKLTIAKRVTPKANRCVMFRGNRFHASSNPKKNPYRIVLNCNFNIKE